MPTRSSDDYHEAYADWADRALRAEAEVGELKEAVCALYDAVVLVVDITNPNLRRDRQRLSRLLDKYEGLRAEAEKRHERDMIHVCEAHAARRLAEAEVERLREALRFYAKGWTPGSQQHREDCDDKGVHGQRAREVLAKDRTGSQDDEWPEGSGPLGF